MITIYHNSRCSKSRSGLAYLESKGLDFNVRQYLTEPFSFEELKMLIGKTGMRPLDLIRTDETYYKETIKGCNLSDDELIAEMIKEPKLIQRPIVELGSKAVLARPTEQIDDLLK